MLAAANTTAHLVSAVADTTRPVTRLLEATPSWAAYVEGWHDFFLLTGTAAVTLVGLLFVSISLHIEALVEPGREHLLQLARVTMMSFVMVLVLSLEILIPAVPRRVLAVQMIALGGVFAITTIRTLLLARGESHQHFTLGHFRRRLVMPLIGYVWIALTGWLILQLDEPAGLPNMLGGVILLLVSALSTSWEMLVRVARIRRSDKQAAERKAKPPVD